MPATDEMPFPPRKKDWKPGDTQIGLFVRTPDGGIVKMVHDAANESVVEEFLKVIRAIFESEETY